MTIGHGGKKRFYPTKDEVGKRVKTEIEVARPLSVVFCPTNPLGEQPYEVAKKFTDVLNDVVQTADEFASCETQPLVQIGIVLGDILMPL